MDKFMLVIEKLLLLLLGPSWRSSLIMLLAGVSTEGAVYLDALPNSTWPGWHFVALLLYAFGRVLKDSVVTGGVVPATREAAARVTKTLVMIFALLCAAPAFAQDVDPTTSTVDGATAADEVANTPATFRFSLTLPFLGKPVLVPAVAITPFAMSLRDGTVTTGLTIGAGYELLWHPATPAARGVAVYANMRSTADGPRPLVSVLGILTPYLGAGVGYQIGGGASAFRDAAVLLLSVGTNLGMTQ
jgi:hypothetical protein